MIDPPKTRLIYSWWLLIGAIGLVFIIWWYWSSLGPDDPRERKWLRDLTAKAERVSGQSYEEVVRVLGRPSDSEMRYTVEGSDGLYVFFNASGVHYLGFDGPATTPAPVDPKEWKALPARRLAMAQGLSEQPSQLHGKPREYVVDLLGLPDQEWIVYRWSPIKRGFVLVLRDGKVRTWGLVDD